MAMIQSTLATEFLNLDPEIDETDAAENMAEAYRVYSLTAEANGITILSAGSAAGKTAMKSALAGMSASGAGAGKMQSAVNAFWAAAIPPGWPTNIGFSAQSGTMGGLQGTFDSNTSGSVDKATATAAIAGVFHGASSGADGTVTFPGPIVATIF